MAASLPNKDAAICNDVSRPTGPPPCIWTFVASVVCWCTYSIFNDSLHHPYICECFCRNNNSNSEYSKLENTFEYQAKIRIYRYIRTFVPTLVGMVKVYPKCVLKAANVGWVVTLLRNRRPCSWTFSTSCFFHAATTGIRDTIPTSLLVLKETFLYPCFISFLACTQCIVQLSSQAKNVPKKRSVFVLRRRKGEGEKTITIRSK